MARGPKWFDEEVEMAQDARTARISPDFTEFPVEVRTIIGFVKPDPKAPHSPLAAAYLMIGEWLADHLEHGGVHLQFRVFDRTFHAEVDEEGTTDE